MGRAANQAPAPPPTDDAEDDARGDDDGLGTHLAVVLDPLLRAPLVEALKRPLALSQRHGVASGRRLCRAGLAHRPQGSSGQPRRAPVDVAAARAFSPTGRPARKFVNSFASGSDSPLVAVESLTSSTHRSTTVHATAMGFCALNAMFWVSTAGFVGGMAMAPPAARAESAHGKFMAKRRQEVRVTIESVIATRPREASRPSARPARHRAVPHPPPTRRAPTPAYSNPDPRARVPLSPPRPVPRGAR